MFFLELSDAADGFRVSLLLVEIGLQIPDGDRELLLKDPFHAGIRDCELPLDLDNDVGRLGILLGAVVSSSAFQKIIKLPSHMRRDSLSFIF